MVCVDSLIRRSLQHDEMEQSSRTKLQWHDMLTDTCPSRGSMNTLREHTQDITMESCDFLNEFILQMHFSRQASL